MVASSAPLAVRDIQAQLLAHDATTCVDLVPDHMSAGDGDASPLEALPLTTLARQLQQAALMRGAARQHALVSLLHAQGVACVRRVALRLLTARVVTRHPGGRWSRLLYTLLKQISSTSQ